MLFIRGMAKLAHCCANLGILTLENRRINGIVFSAKGLKDKGIHGYLEWCVTSTLQPLMKTMSAN